MAGTYVTTHNIKQMEGVLSDRLQVHVSDFGAKTTAQAPGFDSAPAFRSAIKYLDERGGGHLLLGDGEYLLSTYSDTVFTTPYDDGSASPLFTNDTNIGVDPVHTDLKVVLDVPSGIHIHGVGIRDTVLVGPWNRNSSPVDESQQVLICFRTPNRNKMQEFVRNVGLHNMTLYGSMIGVVSDGVLFEDSSFTDLNFNSMAMPFLAMGADNVTFHGSMGMGNCLAGFVIGGWWTQRNNTTAGGKYVPPYVDGTDVYSLGWADFVTFDKITIAYANQPYGNRSLLVDQFFDKYFFKESYSKKVSNGGRLTNDTNSSSAGPDLQGNKYRGIAHRCLVNFSRYGRGNCNFVVKSTKTYGTSRIPFMGPVLQGPDYYGEVADAYIERTGYINSETPWSDANNFYKSGNDPYNADRADLVAGVAEGNFGVGRATYQGMPNRLQSTEALVSNGRSWLQLTPGSLSEISVNPDGGISTSKAIRKISAYTATRQYSEIESLVVGRLETQPIAFYRSDLDPTHLFKHRVVKNNTDMVLRVTNNGVTTTVTKVTSSVVYTAGRVKVFLKATMPTDTSAYPGDMQIAWVPVPQTAGNFGSDKMELNVIYADIVGVRPRDVFQKGSNTIVGETRSPKEFKSVAGGNTVLRLYEDYQRGWQLGVADFAPNSTLEFSIEYNGFWNIWSIDPV